jgi:hypothetical protein
MRHDTLLKVSTTNPWYINIVNYIVPSYIPLEADKKKIIQDSRLHLWMTRICIECALMAY